MAVNVQGEADGGMAQIGLHGLDIVAVFDGRHREAVSQIVEALLRHPDLLDNGLEALVHGNMAEVRFGRKEREESRERTLKRIIQLYDLYCSFLLTLSF